MNNRQVLVCSNGVEQQETDPSLVYMAILATGVAVPVQIPGLHWFNFSQFGTRVNRISKNHVALMQAESTLRICTSG